MPKNSKHRSGSRKREESFDLYAINPEGDPPANSELVERLRICAVLAGSGDALAQEAAIPRRTLETYLSGRAEPKVGRAQQIADAVGVSSEWLLSGRGRMLGYPLRDEAAKQDLQALYALPPRTREVVDARHQVLQSIYELAADLPGPLEEAVEAFVEVYNSGDVTIGGRLTRNIPKLSGADVRAWLHAYRAEGYAGLARDIPQCAAGDTDDTRSEDEILRAEFALIPRYDVDVAAGAGRVADSERVIGRYAFRRDWLRDEGLDPKQLALVTPQGDSMLGSVEPGEPILVNLAPDQQLEDGIYVLRLSGQLVVKRLQLIPPDQVKVISDNKIYEAYTIPLRKLLDPDDVDYQIIGRAEWGGRRFR